MSKGRSLRAKSLWLIRDLQRRAGITEAEIRAIERAEDVSSRFSESPWHEEIFGSRPTDDLDDLTEKGYEHLIRRVDPRWLLSQASKSYRLGKEYLNKPLNIMNGFRVCEETNVPQRFARMLLVTKDHLDKKDDLDFFSASVDVPELAALGNSLAQIAELGTEAIRKLKELTVVPDDVVTATAYELLVGSACVDRGLSLHMVPETRTSKVPDFRVTSFGAVPCVIECKRRLGLLSYEIAEARHVEHLFSAVKQVSSQRGAYGSLEATFRSEIKNIDLQTFVKAVLTAMTSGQVTETWGNLSFTEKPALRSIPTARLYSPDFLKSAFDWEVYNTQWDGIVSEVSPPPSVRVELVRRPICLKWRSESENALLKKSRGLTSLWSKAIKQIQPGEVGFVYIAYPEGARPELADARTQHIFEEMSKVYHPWFIQVPVTVINRLYPRALGCGNPDLIENVLPGVAKNAEYWLKYLPDLVFTRKLSAIP